MEGLFFFREAFEILIVNTLSLNIQFLRMDMSFELMKVFTWYWTGIGISRVLFLLFTSLFISLEVYRVSGIMLGAGENKKDRIYN